MSGQTFFFYGSLMDVELLEAVIDRKAAGVAFTRGWLGGYTAQTAHGYTFPTLVELPQGRVEGIVTQGLTVEDVARIAYFEDTEYAPVTFGITTETAPMAAQVFMATTSLRSTGEPWDFTHWRAHHKPLLIAVTRRVMREHYGITPFEEIDAHWRRIKAELEAGLPVAPAARKRSARPR